MNGKFVYFTGNAKYDAKMGKYVDLKCFGGVLGKNNNKGSFSGVLYVTCALSATA